MTTMPIKTPTPKLSPPKRLVLLIALFALIFVSIFVIRLLPTEESEFVDNVAGQIEQEMADNQIVLSAKPGRRTVADFKDPIILTHQKDSRLIVHTAHLAETISIASEGLGGWEWTSAYQDIVYEGDAQYTVDLSRLSEEDFVVHNELKTLTVRIPYAALDPINIPADQYKNKVTIRMKHNTGASNFILYFLTDSEPNWGPVGNPRRLEVPTTGTEDWVEYVFDMSENPSWKGTIKQLRIDPSSKMGDIYIDYIRVE